MRTLIAGGGTAGHLTPAIAVATRLLRDRPTDGVLLVGRRGGLEERIVPAAGLPLRTLRVRGVDLARPVMTARALGRLPLNVAEAGALLRSFRPDVVVGAAGYVCVPVVTAAALLRFPVVLMEQNAHPGRAVRTLSRVSTAVAASFAETAPALLHVRVVHTGNPVREGILAALPAPLPEAPTRLLSMGGSQGARTINRALAAAAPDLLRLHPALRITHVCGARDADETLAARGRIDPALRERYDVVPFVDEVGRAIAGADLVLMRAGGSSLAEVTALGRPMILVPYPHAGGHQWENARPYERAGAAVVVDDAQLDAARVRREVGAILSDLPRWRAMAEASRRSGRPDAAERVVALIREVAAA